MSEVISLLKDIRYFLMVFCIQFLTIILLVSAFATKTEQLLSCPDREITKSVP